MSKAAEVGVENVYLGFTIWLFFGLLTCWLPDASVPDQAYLGSTNLQRAMPHTVTVLLALWMVATVYLLYHLSLYERAHRSLPRTVWWVLGVGTTMVACYFAWVKPLTSTDVLYYTLYGRIITEHGASPYKHSPSEFMADPFMSQVAPAYLEIPCVYGPIPVAQYALGNLLSPRDDMLAACSTLRLLSVPLCLAVGYLFYQFWRQTGQPATLTFAVMANPVFLFQNVNSAHSSETWMLLGLLLACLGLDRDRPMLSSLGMVIACSSKIVALPVLPVVGMLWFRKSWGRLGIFTLGTMLGMAAIYLPLDGADYRPALEAVEGRSMWNMEIVGGPVVRLLLAMSVPLKTASAIGTLCLLVVVGGLCLWIGSGRCRTNHHGLVSFGMAAVVLTRNYYQMWYTLWFWPSLWLAYRRESNALLAIATWSVLFMAAGFLGWRERIWVLTAAYIFNLAMLARECEQPGSDP